MKPTYEAYYGAPQSLKDIIDSGEIGDLIQELITDTTFTDKKAKLIILTTRRVLSLITREELVRELLALNIQSNEAQRLSSEIELFVSKCLTKTYEPLTESDDKIAQANEIELAEKELNSLLSIRTMAPITPEETVYTSTQAAILHEGQSADQKQTSSARWESES
jgi:hypothetical protein